jgi:hypothetical protein
MKKHLLYGLFSFSALLIFTSGIEDINGKSGRTGSPSEQTCYNGCHSSYALNSGPAVIEITSNIPNWEYTPGQSYTINVTATQSGINLYGIDFEALTSANQNAGTLAAGTGTQIKTTTVGGVARKNLVHTTGGGASSGTHTFTFNWTAPAAGTGNVTFYWAILAANGNFSNSGDYVYTRTQALTEYVAPSGINNIDGAINLNVYPNPASDNIHITYFLNNMGETEIGIYSLEGTLVKTSVSGNETTGSHIATTDISDLAKGIYVIKMSTNTKTISRKIVVQ